MCNSASLGSFEVGVIGGGPAGLAAAIYLARFLRSVVVFDAGDARATMISKTRNCPGFPDGIAGKELLERLRDQAERYGAVIASARVESAQKENGSFILSGKGGLMRFSRVILATGIVDKAPPIPRLRKSIADGTIGLCPVCDAYEARGKRIGVVGPEQRALQEALFLSHFGKSVALLSNCPEDISAATRVNAAAAGIEVWDFVGDLIPTERVRGRDGRWRSGARD
jgi:thioredoxin reductase (NADPH)